MTKRSHPSDVLQQDSRSTICRDTSHALHSHMHIHSHNHQIEALIVATFVIIVIPPLHQRYVHAVLDTSKKNGHDAVGTATAY